MHRQFINDSQLNDRFNRKCFPIQGRSILHLKEMNSIDFSWNIWSKFCHSYIEAENGILKFSIAIPPIALWLTFEHLKWAYINRAISVSFGEFGMHWNLWTDSMGWSSKTPKWRNGFFSLTDFIFGKKKYTQEVIDTKQVEIPMPEKSYQATVEFREDTWKRKRWFGKSITRVDIEIPEGIPHEGKGENFWDCGVDYTFGMCCPANSIADGVGKLVGDVLATRVKYGGWKDWAWNKNDEVEDGCE